ncbi:MAG: Crp/Fnr family transcriptional regulator [Rhodospirillaceae bacterium TMED8]|nr:Crp/Fnr family transcriptional regulator [Magnetovibrio sp.]OUT48894.1 MAG: Crp/Fnr family transcriptional regulator [Rhodospirillaceae bacterium TMED8]
MPHKYSGILKLVGLLEDLDADALEVIGRCCGWKFYPAQEQIIDRQSESTDVFFVIEGGVRVVNYSVSGREITLDDIDQGGHFGELAAIDGEPRLASVMSLTPCRVATLSQDYFVEMVHNYPSVAFKVMRDLAAVVRNSTERVMDLSTLAANIRVQADLLRLATNNMVDREKASISPIPVHSDVASRVSTSRETVARVMNDLARQGIVDRQKDALIISNVKLLRQMVEKVRGD